MADDTTAVLLANSRGHDILSFNSGPKPMRLGSQIESISNCQLDLDAWIHFLSQMGIESVSLLGHSLGAIKCIWWSKNNMQLRALIAVSPPRLNTSLLLSDPIQGAVFLQHLSEADENCAGGHPDFVMKVRFPIPMWICAATYKDKYGSGDKYDYLAMANELVVPTLWTFGEYEVESGSANFKDADVQLKKRFSGHSNSVEMHTVCVISNADHTYRDAVMQLADSIRKWSSRLS
ncbi:MAG TPA: hypothetical protein VM260_12035 [Pirellula sp.]|nr:hypothetical protein [Pirellula sp.]